jgi:hypothetical protein
VKCNLLFDVQETGLSLLGRHRNQMLDRPNASVQPPFTQIHPSFVLGGSPFIHLQKCQKGMAPQPAEYRIDRKPPRLKWKLGLTDLGSGERSDQNMLQLGALAQLPDVVGADLGQQPHIGDPLDAIAELQIFEKDRSGRINRRNADRIAVRILRNFRHIRECGSGNEKEIIYNVAPTGMDVFCVVSNDIQVGE